MVLSYAKGGNLCYQLNKIYDEFNWILKLNSLLNIIRGLKIIHQKQMVHRDFHTGNLLFYKDLKLVSRIICISDMGLCGEVGNTDDTKIYGIMPYVAPEILRGNPYTRAADIYSFGMVMYFIATGKQPFSDFAHDYHLALIILKDTRPEIHEREAPKFYIELMKKCLDSNPKNRPETSEIYDFIDKITSINDKEIVKQLEEAEENRKANLKHHQLTSAHPQAVYVSRDLYPLTRSLQDYGNLIFNQVHCFKLYLNV